MPWWPIRGVVLQSDPWPLAAVSCLRKQASRGAEKGTGFPLARE